MNTIQIFGTGDDKMRALRHNLGMALTQFPLKGEVEEVSEFNKINLKGVREVPALVVDGEILSEGVVPSVEEIKRLLRNRELVRSKLYRLRRILAPIDLSPASENSLRYACQLAQIFGSSVEVVYAMDSIFEGKEPSPTGFLSGYKKAMQEEVDQFVRSVLGNESGLCPTPDFNHDTPMTDSEQQVLRTRIVFGFPEEVLADLSVKADLVVMGTTGRGNLTRKLFGSVSVAVSNRAHCPVLLIPPQAQFKGFKNILYASNFESLDALAIKQTVTFARRFNGQMHFVHVGPAGEQGVDLERKLFEINYIYADPEMPYIFHKIVGDDVIDALHEYAFTQRIDLFIFVTHHRAFWESILHRSMSKEMLLHTSAPVLVIHSENDVLT
jgi:nucleotide-binding universal stress UspA family protein